MEYKLSTLFENLTQDERLAPLSPLEKITRNELIADMMNAGILQFSQEAVDEIVREVNDKKKLDDLYKQVKTLIEKSPKKKIPAGASLIVDTLPDGSLPILKTDMAEYLDNRDPILDGNSYFDHNQKLTLPKTMTVQEVIDDLKTLPFTTFAGVDIGSDVSKNTSTYAYDDKIAANVLNIKDGDQITAKSFGMTDGSPITANSFNRPGMLSPRDLINPSQFNDELWEMGVFSHDYERQDQQSKYITWTSSNYDALRNFIKIYRKCKHPDEKKILLAGIKEVVRDINASKITTWGDAFNSQALINRLVNCNIFLTAKEKATFFNWDLNERKDLEKKITNHAFNNIIRQNSAEELASANAIRDHILKVNKSKEYANHSAILKEIQEGDSLKSPALRKTIKDLVHKLRVWGVIDNNPESCDAQYNKCMNWDPANIDVLVAELNSISEGVLLFEELTKSQMQYIRSIVTQYNDLPKGKKEIPVPPPLPPIPDTSWFVKEMSGFEVLNPGSKYVSQVETAASAVSDPKATSYDINALGGVNIAGPSVSINTPNLTINGKKIDVNKIIEEDNYLAAKEDEDIWRGIFKDIKPGEIKVYPIPILPDLAFDWEEYNRNINPLTKYDYLTDEKPIKEEIKQNKLVGEAKKAGVRVAATQLNKVTKGVLSAALPGDKSAMLQQFLDSELGTSFVSMVNGMALTYAMKDNEKAQIMAKEFRVSSLTTAGNFAVEEILDLVTGVVTDSVSSNLQERSQEESFDPEIEIFYEDLEEDKVLNA
jgi:hypothetical protein